jgi:hypothetical protein
MNPRINYNNTFKRTALVQFRKPRRVFEDFHKRFKPKYPVSDKKERIKYDKRMKAINEYDPEITGEKPMDTITTPR